MTLTTESTQETLLDIYKRNPEGLSHQELRVSLGLKSARGTRLPPAIRGEFARLLRLRLLVPQTIPGRGLVWYDRATVEAGEAI